MRFRSTRWRCSFALLVALAASLIFGVAPALQTSRVQLSSGLREGGKGTSIGAGGAWVRNTFVVAEIALAVALVAAAGVLARSLATLASVDMGFKPDRLLVLNTVFPIRSFDDAPRATAFYRDLLADMRAVPGVDAVGGVTSLPAAMRSNGNFLIEGSTPLLPAGTWGPQRDLQRRDAGLLPHAAGADDARPRLLGERHPRCAIRRHRERGPGPRGVRRRRSARPPHSMWPRLPGVHDHRRGRRRCANPWCPTCRAEPEIFMPYEQHPGPATALNLIVRAESVEPLALADTLRRIIARRSADVPVKASTMEGRLETARATPRFRTFLVVVFAGVALLLALAGVYGVMAYTVSQRIPELGVRIALGATPENIMKLVVLQGAKLAVIGLTLGLGLSLWSARVLEGLLFGVAPRDPLTLILVTAAIARRHAARDLHPGAARGPGRSDDRAARAVDGLSALKAEATILRVGQARTSRVGGARLIGSVASAPARSTARARPRERSR